MSDGGALVSVERLSVVRGRETVLDDVTLAIERGRLHALVGPNGAGKSTLVSAVLGLLPFSGRIVLDWRGNQRIGYVPQSFAVDPTLPVTVGDFLALTRQRRPVCFGLGGATRARVASLLERVALPAVGDRPLAGLSGGEMRRVLLAHALDPEPELLILDEPGTGLDVASLHWLETTLREIRREGRTTIVMISHDVEQVQRLADRATLLDRRVVADGPLETIVEHFASSRAAAPSRSGGARS